MFSISGDRGKTAGTAGIMPNFEYQVEIFAATARIWSTWMDVEHWPDWTPTVNSAKRLDPGPLAVGARTRILQPKLMPAVWRVTHLDEPAGIFIWTTGRPGIKVSATHRVEPMSGGSRVTLALTYAGLLGPLIARQLKSLNWDYLTREAHGLRAHCER